MASPVVRHHRLQLLLVALLLFAMACGVDAPTDTHTIVAGDSPQAGDLGQSTTDDVAVAEDPDFDAPPLLASEEIAARSSALATTIAERKKATIDRYLDDPFPSPESALDADRCWGRAGFALAAYHEGRELDRADRYLREIHDEFGFRRKGPADASPCYFAMPLLLRIYFDPLAHPHLTEAGRGLLLDLMHRYIEQRSQVAVARSSSWHIAMSENHDAIQKATFLLASRALMQAEAPYGEDLVLADGFPVATHYAEWVAFWKRYFRERAREGIGCEIASPIYAKHSLASYQGVRDFAGEPALEARADAFLTLYWADVAQDFLPGVGVRGGAETRSYKNAYLTTGTRQSTRAWTYVYGWHDNVTGSIHPLALIAAASPYAPPALVRQQAIDRSMPYLYTSRRCGRGTVKRIDDEPHYRMRFDAGRGSHLLRTSFVHSEYVIGALTFDPDEHYNALAGQNRTMGVNFASGPDDRIIVHGRGRDGEGTIGYDEITGVVARDVLVVARDPKARRTAGLRIFVANGELWDNRVDYAGWFFTRTEGAYIGIRMAEAGYVVREDPRGVMLDQRDAWTPIVMQLGHAADYESFEDFQSSVASNAYRQTREAIDVTKRGLTTDDYSLVKSRVHYRSEAGDRLTFFSHNTARPRINGLPVDLLPAQTYQSPFLAAPYRADEVTLHHPLFGHLVLDFSQ
ncbi:MAG: hypothetical protein GY944_29320 [bacterium]|nr:hypothetical protein [bacterium]